MLRTNSLQLTKDQLQGSMSVICRSFDATGEPVASEFPFSAEETQEIEEEARSFNNTLLTV